MEAQNNHNEPDLNALAELWVMHKEVENGARDARIDVEQRLMPFLETPSTEKLPSRQGSPERSTAPH